MNNVFKYNCYFVSICVYLYTTFILHNSYYIIDNQNFDWKVLRKYFFIWITVIIKYELEHHIYHGTILNFLYSILATEIITNFKVSY